MVKLNNTTRYYTFLTNLLLTSFVFAQFTPDDPRFSEQWGHTKVQVPEAWEISTGQREIIVGVIDTGVNWEHPDLLGKIWINSDEIAGNGVDDDNNGYVDDVRGYDFYTPDNNPHDNFSFGGSTIGHGSLVAGIIAANIDNGKGIAGICDNVKIMPLKVTNGQGSSNGNLVKAINYAVDNGADIINASLQNWDYSQDVYNALQNAMNAGILVITCAGNDNTNIDSDTNYPSSYDLDNIIPVLATNSDDSRRSNSNYGSTTVDIGAPGADILSTTKKRNFSPVHSYDKDSGTSFAAPYVAGALALVYSACSDVLDDYRSSDPVGAAMFFKNIILESVDDKGLPCSSGGRLNVYKALQNARKTITMVNKRDNTAQTVLDGTLSLFNIDNGINYLNLPSSDADPVEVILGQHHNSRTDQKELIDDTETLRHHRWNGDYNEFRFYHNNFEIDENITTEIAFFKKQHPVYITSDHDITVAIRDPWYVEGGGTVEDPQPDDFHTINEDNPGDPYMAFLDQDPNFLPNLPNYSVSAENGQDIYLSQTGRTHKFYLQNWSATGAYFQDANALETPVVFTSSNATVNANYKGTQLSSNPNAYCKNSQRKFVRTDNGDLHLVYEDNGKVFYERSADNGVTWQIANGGKPLSGNKEGKLPAMDYKENSISIVWQENDCGAYNIKLSQFSGGNFIRSANIFMDVYLPYSYATNPVIVLDGEGRTFVTWQREDDTFSSGVPYGILFWYGTLTSFGVNTCDEGSLPNTDSNSINPALATDKTYSIPSAYHLAWEQTSGSFSSIKYFELFRDGYQKIQTTTPSPETPSNGGAFWTNSRPSIVALDNNTPRLAWIGFAPWFGTRAVLRIKQTNGSWSSTVYSYDYDVKSVSINRTDENDYVLGWSNSSSYSNKYVKNLGPISNFGTTGKDIQVNNSADLNNMYCLAFQSHVTPHRFVKSSSVNGLQKQSKEPVINGRTAVVTKNGSEFICAMEDITLNDELIGFVDINDSTQINSQQDLNKYLITKPFQLDDNSKLNFRVVSGVIDSNAAEKLLKEDKYLMFKIELIDADSDEILNSFANLKYSVNNIKEQNILSYTLNAKGIGKKKTRMRLSLDDNISGKYTLSQFVNKENAVHFGKEGCREVSCEVDLAVTEYALSQNYPNPFNPLTTIKFQIPQDGIVTLKVYDVLGREVNTLVNEFKTKGRYDVQFNGSDFSSGVYMYKLETNNYVRTRKMLLIK